MKTQWTKLLLTLFAAGTLSFFSGCGGDDDDVDPVNETLNDEILVSFSDNVAQASYNDLKAKASTLNDHILDFVDEPSAAKLTAAQNSWKAARSAWEQTESFLFGPVDSGEIDPRIDTWPVNFEDMVSLLTESEEVITEEFVDEELGEDLKGFHPIEYLIFGLNGDKTFDDFTSRELEYLSALSLNLKKLTAEVADEWNPSAGDYESEFLGQSDRDAFEQLVSAMAGIADEVANAKIKEVYEAHDPSLEESPYSQNSLTDFTNNIRGIENVYLGKYATDGKGLEDLVKEHNLALDTEIKAAISAAIAALGNIDGTFGEAVEETNVKVQNAIDAITALQLKLDDGADSNDDLFYFVQQHTN